MKDFKKQIDTFFNDPVKVAELLKTMEQRGAIEKQPNTADWQIYGGPPDVIILDNVHDNKILLDRDCCENETYTLPTEYGEIVVEVKEFLQEINGGYQYRYVSVALSIYAEKLMLKSALARGIYSLVGSRLKVNRGSSEETPCSRLRNALSPCFTLADFIDMLREKEGPEQELVKHAGLIFDTAAQAKTNHSRITEAIKHIENTNNNKY